MTVPVGPIQSVSFSRYGDATIKVSTIQALLRALQLLTIVRENVCNKATKRKLTFLNSEKRKIDLRIPERWC